MRNLSIAAAVAGCALVAGMGSAQGLINSAGPLNNLVTARTNQNLVGASVGTGTTQGKSVVDVSPANGRPAIGVGVGSGKVDHFGSQGSISVANNSRILGVDGRGGPNSPNSISVRNPTQAPLVSSVAGGLVN